MHATSEQKRHDRFHALDSLRGMAALAVCLCHVTYFWSELPGIVGVRLKILHAFMMWGHVAVMLFFVLSGFVLTVGFRDGALNHYIKFIVKRVLRIYPTNIFVLSGGVLTVLVMDTIDPSLLTPLQNDPRPVANFWSLLNASGLVFTSESSAQINFVIWSLVHEMRFALLFPFMLFLLNRWTALFSGFCLLVYLGANVLLGNWGRDVVYMLSDNAFTSWLITLHYLPCFAVGMVAAKLHPRGGAWVGNPFLQIPLVLAGFCIPRYVHEDMLISLWAGCLILAAASPGWISKALHISALQWLGRISYSLYLVHYPIARFLFYSFASYSHPWLIAGVAVVFSLLLGWLINMGIEQPFVRFSHRLMRRGPELAP